MSERTRARRTSPEARAEKQTFKRARYFHRTRKTAAKRADQRRARGKSGHWLSKMPHQDNQSGSGNGGRPPRYLDWPAGKRL